MATAKPLASLSSGLLARKGQARPAMRRQGIGLPGAMSAAGDDLGWNDMGEPLPLPVEASPPPSADLGSLEGLAHAVRPGGRKAAFTLRLDSGRHLQLRLAAATRGRSAQQLLIEALDALIATMPEVERLRRQLPGTAAEEAAPTRNIRGN